MCLPLNMQMDSANNTSHQDFSKPFWNKTGYLHTDESYQRCGVGEQGGSSKVKMAWVCTQNAHPDKGILGTNLSSLQVQSQQPHGKQAVAATLLPTLVPPSPPPWTILSKCSFLQEVWASPLVPTMHRKPHTPVTGHTFSIDPRLVSGARMHEWQSMQNWSPDSAHHPVTRTKGRNPIMSPSTSERQRQFPP